MKTTDLNKGDHVAYKSSKHSMAREAIVTGFRPRQAYGWDRTSTVGITYAQLPDGRDPAEAVFFVRPQEIVSTWSDEVLRCRASEKAAEERQAIADAKRAANQPRLDAVTDLIEILNGGILTVSQDNRLLLGGTITVYVDLDRLEALAATLVMEPS